MIGSRLKDLQATNPPKEPNAYLTWINNYVAEDYTKAVEKGRGMSIIWLCFESSVYMLTLR